jgi:antitoxin ParD1/3/4
MNVNLSETFENYIKAQLAAGIYNNASEVVREALRLKIQQDEIHQAKIKAYQSAITDGLESGAATPLDMNEIIREAKEEAMQSVNA